MKLLMILMAVAIFGGCSEKDPEVKRTEIFVHGDPMNFIKGASLDTRMDFDYIEKSPKLYLFSITSFIEKRQIIKPEFQKRVKLTEANKPRENFKQRSLDQSEVEFSRENNIVSISSETSVTKLFLDEEGRVTKIGNFDLDGNSANTTVSYEALHVSFGPEGRNMSLLLRIQSEYNSSVTALYYTNDKNINSNLSLKKTDKKFNYLLGKGIKSYLQNNGTIEVSACGLSNRLEDEVKDATKKWDATLAGLLKVEVKTPSAWFPFSDLNQNCFYSVDSYMTQPDPRRMNFGLTISQASPNTGLLIDSDIFLLEREFAKEKDAHMMSAKMNSRRKVSILHELGHLIGLHHKFDGTESIMSYKFEAATLSPYDKQAVRELYTK